MSLKRSLLAASALVIGLALLFFVNDSPPQQAALPTARLPPASAAQAQGSRPTLPQAPIAALAAGEARPWLDTLKKFNAATSYRSFVYEADRNQSEGAFHYAVQVISICTNAQVSFKDTDLTTPRQRDAMARLRARCDMSREELVNEFGVMASKMDRLGLASQRLTMADTAFDQASTASAEREAVVAVLATQDPTVMLRLSAPPMANSADTRHFMGSEHDYGEGTNLHYAFRLAQCSLGLDCGPQSPATLLLCVSENWCAASYRDALRVGLGAGRPSRFDAVELLAAQLVQQMRQQNAGAFLRKK